MFEKVFSAKMQGGTVEANSALTVPPRESEHTYFTPLSPTIADFRDRVRTVILRSGGPSAKQRKRFDYERD